MNIQVLTPCDISAITKELIGTDGLLKIKPYSFYKDISENEIKNFILTNGIYVLPTTELIDWLKENITGSAIEIGAGHGAIARSLNIPITDSRMQERPDIALIYELTGQPPVKYADDVEKLDAIEAIEKYRPDTVIGAFITHKFDPRIGNGNMLGVQEEFILEKTKRYINICNKITHKDKPILALPHEEYKFEWLITRAADQSQNAILIFNQ